MSIIKKIAMIIASIFAIIIIILITISITVYSIYNGGVHALFPPGHGNADSFLKVNIDELSYVADALLELYSELGCDSISIYKVPRRPEDEYDTTMRIRTGLNTETIPIPDELFDHIVNLYESGISVILCGSNLKSHASVTMFKQKPRMRP